ncbi:MAG: beta-glucuronidase [Lachnospiraceae bacterium]|nr:beta-glucuronidase [Lachnospiraceae bacterium]
MAVISNVLDLSGVWEFCLDADKVGIEKKYYGRTLEDTIVLPGTTAEAKKGIHGNRKETGYLTEPYHFEGYAWYSRTLEIPEECIGDLAQLVIERTRISYVWLDDIFVGTQESFATVHSYDLTKYLTKMSHRLTIMVSNVDYKTSGGHMTSPDTQTNWNGMLGRIALFFEKAVRVSDLCVMTDAETRSIGVRFALEWRDSFMKSMGNLPELTNVVITCVSRDDSAQKLVESCSKISIRPGMTEYDWQIEIPEEQTIALWNEYTPNLYEVAVKIVTEQSQTVLGQAMATVGFRDLHTEGRTFYLNDLPIMLRGKHDGMIFPLTGYAPMDKASWLKLFSIAREYGINHYRFHTCCPPEAAFEAADEMGIYLAPELPFWGTVAGEEETDKEREAREWLLQEGFRILKTFGNHPSFLIFSLGNELWGSQQVLNDILGQYKAADKRHWYVQGSNNFQFCPVILENDDFFSGVRFSKDRLFRGSYAMCDAPQGHIQVNMPDSCYSYDDMICPVREETSEEDERGETLPEAGGQAAQIKEKDTGLAAEVHLQDEVEIQFGTGTKKVKAQKLEELTAHVPVVSHEIGQYEIYPDYNEIEKYTGVLQPENLRIFRKRLEEKGMLHMAEKFFRASGHLAVECYKRELETAFRSRELAGFQLLDLQDFTGQGTALVGILDAFMDNKGLISAGEWREFCNDRVVMLKFPTYVYQAGGQFEYEVQLCDMRPEDNIPVKISVTMTVSGRAYKDAEREDAVKADVTKADVADRVIACEYHEAVLELTRLKSCGRGSLPIPDFEEPTEVRVTVSVTENLNLMNHYDIYVYPAAEKRRAAKRQGTAAYSRLVENRQTDMGKQSSEEQEVLVTGDMRQMLEGLRAGRKVLYFGDSIWEKYSIEGTYCTDFWCYPMFASISESMGRTLPIGTMGLCMDEAHPLFNKFPTSGCTTPQWWNIVTNARVAVLDDLPVEPIIWMIDNFGRNHKLGLLFEGKAGAGSLLVCQSKLHEIDSPEVNWFYNSLLDYMESEYFAPAQEIEEAWLEEVYGKKEEKGR